MEGNAGTAVDGGVAVGERVRVQEGIDATKGDVEGASQEEDQAQDTLDALLKARAGWDASLRAIDAVHNAARVWRCESMDRVARIVGAYFVLD